MRVIAKKALVEYSAEHKDAETALGDWYVKTVDADWDWDCFADIRRTFNSADYVGNNRIVFNIRGNQYRLVTLVLFRIKMVYIRFIGTHEEYDRIRNIEKI